MSIPDDFIYYICVKTQGFRLYPKIVREAIFKAAERRQWSIYLAVSSFPTRKLRTFETFRTIESRSLFPKTFPFFFIVIFTDETLKTSRREIKIIRDRQ